MNADSLRLHRNAAFRYDDFHLGAAELNRKPCANCAHFDATDGDDKRFRHFRHLEMRFAARQDDAANRVNESDFELRAVSQFDDGSIAQHLPLR